MKKNDYQKPAIEIAEMRHQIPLMYISGGEAMRTGYGISEKQNWGEDTVSNQSNIWEDKKE